MTLERATIGRRRVDLHRAAARQKEGEKVTLWASLRDVAVDVSYRYVSIRKRNA